jgi:queuine tRNA-ribosyltransferase subunit QTRTD1 homolog
MEFIAKCIPSNEMHNFARLGTLSITINNLNLDCQPNKTVTYSTPLCLQYTKAASIPHLSWDLAKLVGDDNAPALVSIANTFSVKPSFDSFQGGISSFANINSERPVVLTLEDKLMPSRSGFNGKKGVSIWTDSGRKQVDVKQLVDFVNKYKPNVCHVFGDGDTFKDSSNKRNLNSVIHSLYFLDSFMVTLRLPIF